MTVAAGDLIAVTGGTGAVGRQVVADLLHAGYRARTLSRSQSSGARVEHVAVDLGAADPLPRGALDGCSAIVHLAAYIPPNQQDPACAEQCFQTNALGTLKLLEAAEQAGVARFLQTSSANAYAPALEAPCEEDAMYPAERAPFYLSSKIAQDVFGSYWAKCRRLPVATLRLSSVYGAGIETALFTRFARSLLAGDPIRLANGGSFGADFVEVSDVSQAVLLFLRDGATGPFNIASGERTTLLEAARLLMDLTGSAEEQLQVDGAVSSETGFPQIDISKARAAGYRPTDLRTGLAKLVEWLREGSET